MFLLVSVLGYQTPLDIIAMLAAVTCALALAQKSSTMYRVFMVINGVLWLVFDILTKTYTKTGVGCYYDSATDTYFWVQLFG